MPDISLRCVDSGGGETRLNVIFVHGLGGDPVTTWCHKGGENDGYFWPKDIAGEIDGAAVYILGYPGDKAAWGDGWPIAEFAVAILDKLMNSRALRTSRTAPIAFVCHSLGGLIIKKLVVTAHLERGQQPSKGEFLDRIAGVVFLATPHDGSIIANIATTAYWFVSKALSDLKASDTALLELGHFYRDRIANEEVVIRHRVYYEKLGVWGTNVVTPASADLGLAGVRPVPIKRDHIHICKPQSKDDPVYEGVVAFLEDEVLRPRKQNQNDKLDEVLALTRRLLENNTSPAAPGAERAVGEAVQSFAQGAEAGDTRLQQALAFLKDNKIAEAEPLLRGFAEDKEARVQQDQKEAAIAYRNLGAIAGLRDPKAAREAYAKAVALDPDNADGLFWGGWFQLEAKNLAAAEKSYRALIQLAGKGADEDQIFWARIGLGDVAVARGDLNAALAASGEARSVMEGLAGSDTGNADWQRDLSVSYDKVGGVQEAQGNLSGALKSYSDGLTIVDRLAKSDPGNAGWQRDLSVSYEKIGDVQEAQGNLSGALKSYSDSLAIRDRLAKSDPGNAGWQRDLSVSYNRVGGVQEAQGNLSGALKSYSDSLAIRDRLAKSDPGNAGWQRDLSVSYEKLGDVQEAQGDLAGALKSYSDSLAIRDRLAKSDPGNAGWQRDLSVSYEKVGDVQEAQGDLSGALKSYSDSLAISRPPGEIRPRQCGLAARSLGAYNKVGDVQEAQGNLSGALKSYSDSLAISERLAKSDPGNAGWQRDLSVSYNKVGGVQVAQGDLAGALKSYSDSLAIRDRLAKSDPGNAGWQRDLSVSYAKLASVHRQSGDKAKARGFLRQGQAIMVRLTKLSPDNAIWKRDLAWFEGQIKELDDSAGRSRASPRSSKHP